LHQSYCEQLTRRQAQRRRAREQAIAMRSCRHPEQEKAKQLEQQAQSRAQQRRQQRDQRQPKQPV